MKINKKLLIVYNIFGISDHSKESVYYRNLDGIFEHVRINNLENDVRVVVSAVQSGDEMIQKLKERYGEKLKIFKYEKNLPVQVTSNKSILSSIEQFNEEYDGYLYVSSAIDFPPLNNEKNKSFLPTLISKNETNEYGIILVFAENDSGIHGLRADFNTFNYDEDYEIPISYFVHFHIGLFNKELKNFYGKPITDVHGFCGMEEIMSYTAYALRKKFTLLGGFKLFHGPSYDGPKKFDEIPCGLNWGRTIQNFINDKEGVESGLGYSMWSVYQLQPDFSKYDSNNFSIDERLKYAVKRQCFSNENEINYNTIEYQII